MNFQHMPILAYPYGYPVTLGVMAIIAAGMLLFFKIRKWF
jgi:magnesium transporter